MRAVQITRLIALDATWYFSSHAKNIHCPSCSCIRNANGQTTHFHSAITPVIVNPGHALVVPLRPEFIVPQDGHAKQDCAIARMRWPFHEWGAHAVLAGHDHIYTNGLVYFVNGLGGDSKDKFHTTPVAGSVVRYSADFGAMRVDASENYILFRFFNRYGTQLDSHRMVPKVKTDRER